MFKKKTRLRGFFFLLMDVGIPMLQVTLSKPKTTQESEVYVENSSLKAHYPPTAT